MAEKKIATKRADRPQDYGCRSWADVNELKYMIGELIDEAHYMKNAYFWAPPSSASSRRWYESQHSIGPIEWTDHGVKYTAEFETSCSCNNIYTDGRYHKGGKSTNLTAIKASHQRMSDAIEAAKARKAKKETVEEADK